MRRWMGSLAIGLALLLGFAAAPASAGSAHLVADLATGLEPLPYYAQNGSAFFDSYTPVNGRVVFLTFFRDQSIYPEDFQCGLWVTDGTMGGTERLAELCADLEYEDSEQHGRNAMLATTGAVAFLTDGTGRVWRTDGTAAGTFDLGGVRLADSNDPNNVNPFVVSGQTFFFSGCTPDQGCEPWVTDGTRRGTKALRYIAPRSQSSSPAQLTATPEGGAVFSASGRLWFSDGTTKGTIELLFLRGYVQQILVRGPVVYVTDVGHGTVVWAVDRTTRQVRMIKKFGGDIYAGDTKIYEVGGRILITSASDAFSLWETDGTRAGTHPIGPSRGLHTSIFPLGLVGGRVLIPARLVEAPARLMDLWVLEPGLQGPHPLLGCPGGCPQVDFFTLFTPFEGNLFFIGWDEAHGYELWKTDGTAQGTLLVKDLCPGPCDGDPQGFRAVAGRLLFEDVGNDLWATSGTPETTVRIAATPLLTLPADLAALDDRIVFTVQDPLRGPQPMVTRLDSAGTELILPLGNGRAAGSFGSFFPISRLGARSIFTACGENIDGVWVSDGTAAGTFQLPVGDTELCLSSSFVSVGNLVYFSWGKKLWRTDGTPGGTLELLDLGSFDFPQMADVGGKLLFMLISKESELVREIWTSDGTPQGTRKVFQKLVSAVGLISAGNEAYFVDLPQNLPPSIYRTDGTEDGTRPIARAEGMTDLVRLNGKVYFIAKSFDRDHVSEIWETDGTATGTAPMIPDLAAPRPVNPVNLTLFQGALYFFTNGDGSGVSVGLWRSDGTAAGTRLVTAAIQPPFFDPGFTPKNFFYFSPLLTPVGDTLFFRANDGVHGTELWKTDGTAAGTVLVRDIAPGTATARLPELTAANGKLYFTATDTERGLELWESDGTEAGTILVDDVQPGHGSSAPSHLTAADGQLFFTANDGEHGRELWVLPF
ncbi:MAG TPA: ELWxxDGT repeat protein [Thermoanaerobaculia bacterium]|nr:ELWxxDGT repeat protein [Thermoanaerobaculia bacterium]